MRTNWETYKRKQILSYPKRRNKRNLIIAIIVIALFLLIMSKI